MRHSKIIINIHNDDSSLLELHRLQYALSLGKCIISEKTTRESDMEFSYLPNEIDGLYNSPWLQYKSNRLVIRESMGSILFVKNYSDIIELVDYLLFNKSAVVNVAGTKEDISYTNNSVDTITSESVPLWRILGEKSRRFYQEHYLSQSRHTLSTAVKRAVDIMYPSKHCGIPYIHTVPTITVRIIIAIAMICVC